MDSLIQVLNKLTEVENKSSKRNVQSEVKKAVVQLCQSDKYTQKETLVFLNQVLEEWDKPPVTIGCVRHHWKK
ncbi:hypothetical protein [Fictibacillus sp. S7]|uniref:hypothetical protein n=1 Tax=Fictibacillus sp. S7 TaxID=2212476 RepID=UPI00101275D9|nr:hypothetical protein [Fictibacillus sp. S7]RXY98561.1 hypothetical protein DMO16_02135 [Fictibacillus sp. S7]